MEKKLNCIAVDDNPLFLNQLEAYLDEIDWLELIASYNEPVKAATGIITHKPDLIFLDIEMPHVNGYAMVEWLLPNLNMMEKKPHIVIISANKEIPHDVSGEFLCYINKSAMTDSAYLKLTLEEALSNREHP